MLLDNLTHGGHHMKANQPSLAWLCLRTLCASARGDAESALEIMCYNLGIVWIHLLAAYAFGGTHTP